MKNLFGAAGVALGLSFLVCAAEPFAVDFSRVTGTIKRLNGVCNAAPVAGTQTGGLEGKIRELEIPFYRFHDAPLENPGYSLVDVSRIFPLFHLDADDPRNYCFQETNDYIRHCVEEGAQIEFRLGESIEHARRRYRVVPPKDFEKWAEVCAHIVRHYNCGWADGHLWNIKYWSVWEEPDNQELFHGEDAYHRMYFPLYETTAKRLKSEFPDIKIGGPNATDSCPTDFIDFCRDRKLPLDFVGLTRYRRTIDSWGTFPRALRKCLDERGYGEAEIFVSEWHYGPISWDGFGSLMGKPQADELRKELTGVSAVAFTAATLIALQDEPVDAMFFYEMKSSLFGLFDKDLYPTGHYYAFKAFALLAQGRTRVQAELRPAPNWHLLAARDDKGRGRALLAAMHTEGNPRLTLKGCERPTSVKVIDSIRNLEEVVGWTWDNGVLTIPRHYSDCGVWLIEVEGVR